MSYLKKKLALKKLRKLRIPLADDNYRNVLRSNDNRKISISQHNYQKPWSQFQPIDEDKSDDDFNDDQSDLKIIDMPGNISAAPFGFSVVFVDFEIFLLDRMHNETLKKLTYPRYPNGEMAQLGRYVTVIQGSKRCFYNIMQKFDLFQPLRYWELATCLELVREHMLANGCRRVALDKLCCNKAISRKKRLSWSIVRNMIHAAFAYSDIEQVLIYCEGAP